MDCNVAYHTVRSDGSIIHREHPAHIWADPSACPLNAASEKLRVENAAFKATLDHYDGTVSAQQRAIGKLRDRIRVATDALSGDLE